MSKLPQYISSGFREFWCQTYFFRSKDFGVRAKNAQLNFGVRAKNGKKDFGVRAIFNKKDFGVREISYIFAAVRKHQKYDIQAQDLFRN